MTRCGCSGGSRKTMAARGRTKKAEHQATRRWRLTVRRRCLSPVGFLRADDVIAVAGLVGVPLQDASRRGIRLAEQALTHSLIDRPRNNFGCFFCRPERGLSPASDGAGEQRCRISSRHSAVDIIATQDAASVHIKLTRGRFRIEQDFDSGLRGGAGDRGGIETAGNRGRCDRFAHDVGQHVATPRPLLLQLHR